MAAKGILRALGEEVRACRTARGLSQEGLAGAADLHRNFIGSIERGQRNVTLLTLVALAEALEVSVVDLVGRVERRIR